MKIIIFEGVDKVGKTTLIERISKELTDIYGKKVLRLTLPFSMEKPNASNEISMFRLGVQLDVMKKMSKKFSDDYVLLCDRFHLSEFVYDNALRRYQPFDKAAYQQIDKEVSHLKTLIIYQTTSNIGDLYEKFKDESGLLDGLSYSQYIKSHILFEEAYQATKCSTKIKVDRDKVDGVVSEIIEFLGML